MTVAEPGEMAKADASNSAAVTLPAGPPLDLDDTMGQIRRRMAVTDGLHHLVGERDHEVLLVEGK
jgi:hypothetical protein